MANKLVRLTEGDLHRIIKESVKNVLNEAKVTPSKYNSNFYDENEIDGDDFSVGKSYETGSLSKPVQRNIMYKGKYAGQMHQGGRNFGRDFTFSAPDVEYGNKNGWGQMKYFKRADEYENYITQNWDKICALLDSGVDFD